MSKKRRDRRVSSQDADDAKSLEYPGCPQCGAHELVQDGPFLRCSYCNSVFEVAPDPEPKVIVRSGANVVFGRHVVIHGNLKIEPGAHVKFTGKLKLVRKGK